MTNEDQRIREWLERNGMILTEEQDRQVRKWLDDNDAKLFAVVQPGLFIAQIHRPGTAFYAVAESFESLGEAVRHAQLAFDLRVIQAVRRGARVVGRA